MKHQAINGVDEELGVIAYESIYIHGTSLTVSVAGFLYWVIVAKLVLSSVLGTASTVIS